MKWIEKVTGSLEDKRQWRAHKARTAALPESYRTAIEAIERYAMFFGPGTWEGISTAYDDLADLFEQAAADGTPIRELVGENPVEFVEAFLANYPASQWIGKERRRLNDAIGRAEGGES